METYLVTGGAGFIGSNIVDKLLSQNHNVRILDNFSTGKKANIERVVRNHSLVPERDYLFATSSELRIRPDRYPRLFIIDGDLREPDTCWRAVSGVTYVLHQGAVPSVPRSISDPVTTNDVNIRGTLNMLIAARDEGVKRVVLASSSSVYGDTPTLPKIETMPPSPLSPYALSKLTAEFYAVLFNRLYGLSTVSLRYFNVFGPGQDPLSQYAAVIPKFITASLNNNPPAIYGDGEQSRDFTFVEDCVSANILACKAERASGAVMNIACGFRTTLNELFSKICKVTGASVEPLYEAARPGDVKHSLADISIAKDILKYQPAYSLDDGLKITVEWFRKNL